MSRQASLFRKTNETDITVSVDLDGQGVSNIDTGVGFFDQMLTLLSRHGCIDLEIAAKGDLHVDQHHTVEDVGICL
ncbi:MAG: imidazoleglycerol-phosphate dehydratase, partial [Pirellulales bacterium]